MGNCAPPFVYQGASRPNVPQVNEICPAGSSITGTVTLSAGNDPRLEVRLTGNSPQYTTEGISVLVDLTYQGVVEPLDPNNPVNVQSVPLVMQFMGSVTCSNTDSAGHLDSSYAVFSVSDSLGLGDTKACLNGVGSGGSVDYTGYASLTPGVPFNEAILVHATIGRGSDGDPTQSAKESADAFLDPVIQIDPTWQYANDFVVVFSPSLSADVPEPNFMLPLGTVLLAIASRISIRRIACVETRNKQPSAPRHGNLAA
jgi:hypothetical protein